MDSLLDKSMTISDILIRDNGVTIEGGTDMVKYLVLSFNKLLDQDARAVNYMTMELHCGSDKGLGFTKDVEVTIRRLHRPTAHELRQMAEDEVKRLQALLSANNIPYENEAHPEAFQSPEERILRALPSA